MVADQWSPLPTGRSPHQQDPSADMHAMQHLTPQWLNSAQLSGQSPRLNGHRSVRVVLTSLTRATRVDEGKPAWP